MYGMLIKLILDKNNMSRKDDRKNHQKIDIEERF